MTTLSTAQTVLQDPVRQQAELDGDVRAAAPDLLTGQGIHLLQTHPSILRRLAAQVAGHVPAETDRLVGNASDDAALATAVALHTGLPFALIAPDASVLGELHPGERVVLIATTVKPGRASTLRGLDAAGVHLLTSVTAVDATGHVIPRSCVGAPTHERQ